MNFENSTSTSLLLRDFYLKKNSVFNFKLIKILIPLLYFSIIISNLTLLFLFLKSVNESKQSSFYLFYYVTNSYH